MHISNKCSIAVHCLVFLSEYGEREKVTSELLSCSTGCNPVTIRNILSALKKDEIITVKPGTGGAALIERIVRSPLAVHAVSTFLTTEILGWGIYWFTRFLRRGDASERPATWNPRIGLLLLAVGVIFVLRLAYVELFASPSFSADRLYRMSGLLASNSVALIVLLCVNIIFVRHMRRHAERPVVVKGVLLLIFVLLTTACVALLAGLHLPFGFDRSFSWREFFQLSILTLLVEMTLYSLIFMIDYALVARSVLRVERGRTHQAQFLHMKPKQQVNPHFLYNTLDTIRIQAELY